MYKKGSQMSKNVEDVLSEILCVPCTEVQFSYNTGYFTHGMYLNFVTNSLLPNRSYGSITSIKQIHSPCGYECNAILLKGEETSRIVRAIADELVR